VLHGTRTYLVLVGEKVKDHSAVLNNGLHTTRPKTLGDNLRIGSTLCLTESEVKRNARSARCSRKDVSSGNNYRCLHPCTMYVRVCLGGLVLEIGVVVRSKKRKLTADVLRSAASVLLWRA